MKVKEIAKHSSATRIFVRLNKEPFTTLAEVNYTQIEYETIYLEHVSYDTWVHVPKSIMNMTVDFISPYNTGALTIYVKENKQ